MQYRDIAKVVIKEYAQYIVDEGYTFDSYGTYSSVFCEVLRVTLGLEKSNEYAVIAKGYKQRLKNKCIYATARRYREIVFNTSKALFDIVIRELRESEGNTYGM